MQEIATVSKGAASLHGHVPSHLPHPLLVRVNGDPGDVHLAALKMDEKQDVVCHQSAQREDLHGEKVGPRQPPIDDAARSPAQRNGRSEPSRSNDNVAAKGGTRCSKAVTSIFHSSGWCSANPLPR